ncbi:DUF3179 domain-containing protein [Oceanithermus desulfurans]|uniref:DUF3179 domain-containing protein n=2 Tax=Oceanithermus desulfurans TaxID=227924 RepID=A0A511RKQ9_9DEIN|nr:DUF3179 domain-containing protein [Oceanithermus desulfurans]MBB6028728.1 hypothetical protein [Oceanithermus desulfurans]GEM90229.1 hypothetical protein ODE01S_16630 [Oceanithermus desulfurans NBRC 100063]
MKRAAWLGWLLLGSALAQGAWQLLEIPREGPLVSLQQVEAGGPPPQGIPALGFSGSHNGAVGPSPPPRFESVERARGWLDAREPVLVLELAGEARAYPLQILVWHEIVNDVVAGRPVAVSYCPLCNSGLAFDRKLRLSDAQAQAVRARNPGALLARAGEGWTLEVTFGTSGMLYKSNLLMFDNATATLWSQILGMGVVGTLRGVRLTTLPLQMLGFGAFARAFPEGRVLSRDTGFERNYGENPYFAYDAPEGRPFLFRGQPDARLPAMERVVAVRLGNETVAYPYGLLREVRVVNDGVGGVPLVVFWRPGTASALDRSSVARGRDVGAAGVFDRRLGGRELAFVWDDAGFVDLQTKSRWDLLGRAVAGPLAGKRLEPVAHDNTLWFAWAAFFRNTRVYGTGPQP